MTLCALVDTNFLDEHAASLFRVEEPNQSSPSLQTRTTNYPIKRKSAAAIVVGQERTMRSNVKTSTGAEEGYCGCSFNKDIMYNQT